MSYSSLEYQKTSRISSSYMSNSTTLTLESGWKPTLWRRQMRRGGGSILLPSLMQKEDVVVTSSGNMINVRVVVFGDVRSSTYSSSACFAHMQYYGCPNVSLSRASLLLCCICNALFLLLVACLVVEGSIATMSLSRFVPSRQGCWLRLRRKRCWCLFAFFACLLGHRRNRRKGISCMKHSTK